MDHRRGVALLLALVTMVVLGACVMALWHAHAGTLRSERLRSAGMQLGDRADSVLAEGIRAAIGGAWRAVSSPGAIHTVSRQRTADGEDEVMLARLGWQTLLVRGFARRRTGVSRVSAEVDDRIVIPLHVPLRLPTAALTGVQRWSIDSSASVDVSVPVGDELRCRDGMVPQMVLQGAVRLQLDSGVVTPVDPDTVTRPIVGVFRLTRDRISHPIVVEGMVVTDTGLSVGADLQIAGVLVVQGSVQTSGGRLDVTGAVISGDAHGGVSGLGSGDRVRYDACAIRRAVERATRPGPSGTWTAVGRS